MRIIYLVCFLFGGMVLNAQTFIRILNEETGEPVPFASISFESKGNHEKKPFTSNEKGELREIIKGSVPVKISSVGYISKKDTIQEGPQYIILLTPTVLELEGVVVTASAKPQLRDKSIYQINVISNAQIRERAASNLADLLATQPGLRVEQNGALGSSVRMQGLSGNQVKILVDGVPVIGRVNNNINLNQLNLQNTDHIEIIEGPMSVIYGSDAMGGVINIITRENTRKNINASTDIYYETIGKYNASIQANVHNKEHGLSITGSRNFFHGAALQGDSGRVQTWRPLLQYNFDANYLYTKNSLKLKYSLSLFNEEFRILDYPRKDTAAFLTTDSTSKYHAIAFDAINYTSRTVNKLEYSNNLKNNTINLVGAYSTFRRSLISYRNDLTLLQQTTEGVANQDTQTISSVMMRGMWSNDAIRNIEFFGGSEFNFDHAVDKSDFGTKEMIDFAGFLNLKYSPLESLSFQPGIRLIYNSLFSAPVVYALNLKYKPNKNWSARVSYSKGYRSPTLKELYFKYTALEHQVYGNPDLKPEYSNNTNVAINFATPIGNTIFGFNLNGFYDQMKNKIDYLQDSYNELKATLINLPIDLYKNFGGDFILSFKIRQQINIETGAEVTAVSTLKNSSTFNYSKSYTGNINYHFNRLKSNVSVNYKYFGDFVIYNAVLMPDGTLDIENESIAGGYHNMDALINKQLLKGKIDLGFGAKNIFDNTRVKKSGINNGGVSTGLVGYGRSYFVKFTYRIN